MNVDSILEWIKNLFVTIPESVIQDLLKGFILFILYSIFVSLKKYLKRISNYRIKFSLSDYLVDYSINIKKLRIIESPRIENKVTKTKTNVTHSQTSNSTDDFWLFLFILIGLLVGLVTFIKKYAFEISYAFQFYGTILILISIFIIVSIPLKQQIQESSLKYILFSTPIALYTIYYGKLIPELAKNMSSELSSDKFWLSAYQGIGLIIIALQIIIVSIFIIRIVSIFFYRKKQSIGIINWFIKETAFLDNSFLLVFIFCILTIMSYGFTSGMFWSLIS